MIKTVAKLVCIMHHPAGEGAETTNEKLFYNNDLIIVILAQLRIFAESMCQKINGS